MLNYNKFNLYLIRHGESIINALPDRIGQFPDTPLSNLGKEQSKKLKQRFKQENVLFDIAYTSSYDRAIETSKLALPLNQVAKIDDRLREYSPGLWVNSISRRETLTPEIRAKMNLHAGYFLPPEGESLNQVERRVGEFIDDNLIHSGTLSYMAKQNKDQNQPILNVGVFSHGMTIKVILKYIMGFDSAFTSKIDIENTSITKLAFSSKRSWKLMCVNDFAHLK